MSCLVKKRLLSFFLTTLVMLLFINLNAVECVKDKMSMSSKKGSINNSLSDDHLCYSVSNKNHRTDSDLYISQNNKKWEVIKTVQLGSVLPSSYSDIDGDMLPEIVVSYDAFGGRQERGEVGYTKILELDPSSGLFTTELLSIETQEPVHLHPIQPFNNGTSYFLLNGLKSYDFHDYYYLVSYNDGVLSAKSNVIQVEDTICGVMQYDFDKDAQTDIFTIFDYYEPNWCQHNITSSGIFSYTSTPFNQGSGLFVQDMDNDLEMDLIVSGLNGELNIYNYNKDTDAFSSSFTADVGEHLIESYSWDYDLDGHPNLMVFFEPNSGNECVVTSYEWDSNSSVYGLQPEILTTELKYYKSFASSPIDFFGTGGQQALLSGVKGGSYEFGYITFNEGALIYNELYSTTYSHSSYVPVQIDSDPEVEFIFSYLNSTDDKVWNQIVDYAEESDKLIMDEFFSDDIFSSGEVWGRTDESVFVDTVNGSLKISSDGEFEDGFSVQTTNNIGIIEIRTRVANGAGLEMTPCFGFRNQYGQPLIEICFSPNPLSNDGWKIDNNKRPVNGWTNDYRGPFSEGTWWDSRMVINDNHLTLFAKSAISMSWELIATVSIQEELVEFFMMQSRDEEIEVGHFRMWVRSGTSNPMSDQSNGSHFIGGMTFAQFALVVIIAGLGGVGIWLSRKKKKQRYTSYKILPNLETNEVSVDFMREQLIIGFERYNQLAQGPERLKLTHPHLPVKEFHKPTISTVFLPTSQVLEEKKGLDEPGGQLEKQESTISVIEPQSQQEPTHESSSFADDLQGKVIIDLEPVFTRASIAEELKLMMSSEEFDLISQISGSSIRVLLLLFVELPIVLTNTDIHTELGLSQQNVSRIVSRLEKLELVMKEPVLNDTRKNSIKIMEKGLDVLYSLHKVLNERI